MLDFMNYELLDLTIAKFTFYVIVIGDSLVHQDYHH